LFKTPALKSAVLGWWGGVISPPPLPPSFPSCSMDISFKDDVTVILLLDVSYMCRMYVFSVQFVGRKILEFLKNCCVLI
jgi:hypothetical protein